MGKENKFYITSPIYYINDRPHIGHAYSTIAADILARHYRKKLGDHNVRFSVGTDENSKKTIEAATLAKKDTSDYANEMAKIWQTTWDSLGITYTDFIRTTDKAHHEVVAHFVTQMYQAGDIYKGNYEGKYCYKCEAFYRDDELTNDACPIHKIELELVKEENWFFALSKYESKLRQWIESAQSPVRPETRKNEVIAFIDRGLEDISISRANQAWGIDVPFDKSQKIYVWVDALINYLTVAGYPNADYEQWWQCVHHIVGKDIIKFHCLIWPAMLLSAGVELPQVVFAHGFFTIDGEKISKSLGNGVDPIELTDKYGNDALRYYLLREIPFGADGDFSHSRFAEVYNSDLANDLGNLVSRVANMINRFAEGKYNKVDIKTSNVDDFIERLAFSQALDRIFELITSQNRYIEEKKPWELYKADIQSTHEVLNHLASNIELIAQLLQPFLPDTADKIHAIFKDGTVADSSIPILFPKDDVS